MPPSLLHIDALSAGVRNSISDAVGVTVGYVMIAGGDIQTSVTVVRPHAGDSFVDKVPTASVVFNGFGKSTGLVQTDELGVPETPIALTNTFAVSAVAQAQIRQAMAASPQIGRVWPAANPFASERNDGYLSDLQAFAVQGVYYDTAYVAAAQTFEQSTVEAGRGMSSFGVKGGINSVSRVVTLVDDIQRTVDALVLPNFGVTKNLTLGGCNVGAELVSVLAAATPEPERGLIITLVTIDAPLDARQLRRLILRAGAGLVRTGSVFDHDSGDIALAFSTAYIMPHEDTHVTPTASMTHESHPDLLFQAVADSVEQAIVHALFHATAATGRDGNTHRVLTELL